MKIYKFGGTSVGTVERMKHAVGNILHGKRPFGK